jgi:rhamnose transport system permease protein
MKRLHIPRHLYGPLTILIVATIYGSIGSPYFLSPTDLVFNTGPYIEIGLLSLGLTLVIINGDIDLSVASNLAASAAVLAKLFSHGVPIFFCCVAAIVTGLILGTINGLIIIKFQLPSLVVTLGTLALYRGLTQVMLGDSVIANYPEKFIGFDMRYLFKLSPGMPYPLALYIVTALIFYYILHRTNFGISLLMSGSNRPASRFSGIREEKIRLITFSVSGLLCGICAVLITSRLGSTISNVGLGLELLAITVVVLGGTDIFGGRGSMSGTIVALFAIMLVRQSMVIQNINGQVQDAAIGLLLILTVLFPRITASIKEKRGREEKRFNAPQTSSVKR